MTLPKLRFGCGLYDRVIPLYSGEVKPQGIDFEFIGNDNPQALKMFDAQGQLQITQLTLRARDVWDAGSEIFDPATAALVGNARLHADQNSEIGRAHV